MKRFFALLLGQCLMLGLCACNGAADSTTPSTTALQPGIRLDEPVFDYIAYSRIDKGDMGPINSEEHLRYCASLPFTTLKADVQPTSDGGLILCHDKGFSFVDGRIGSYNKEDALAISSLTTERCLSLEYRTQYNGKYCKVADFETFIRICKESGKWAFITVRDEHVDQVVAAAMPILEKYDWVENSIINSFTLSTLDAFRKASPDIKLSYVLQYNQPITRKDVDAAVKLGNCVLTSFHFRVSDIQSGWATMDASADGITYAKAQGVRLYQAQVCEGVDLQKLKEYGYSGAQLRFVPDFE